MEVKIVFSDIDGTFLTSDHKVTEKTEKAVKKLLEKKIPFILVSGRMPEAIYPITEKIGIKIPIICYNGGLILTEKEEIIYSEKMKAEDTQKILNEISKNYSQVTVNYYSGRKWYVKDIKNERVIREMEITKAKAENANFEELIKNDILPNKLLIMSDTEMIEKMENELGKKFPELNIIHSSKHLLEIMDKSVNKGKAVEIMLKHYNFLPENSIAFGDNYNDIDMIKVVGCGVIMGNAPDYIKKIGNEITDSNNDSGIYSYLIKKNIIQD
jgi:Cof subfamily protein (haloacid dehalogenase superfamily)